MSWAVQIAKKLGAAQRRGLLALPADGSFGASGEYAAMRRLWFRADIPSLIDHAFQTDDCWSLRKAGQEVRAAIAKAKGDA